MVSNNGAEIISEKLLNENSRMKLRSEDIKMSKEPTLKKALELLTDKLEILVKENEYFIDAPLKAMILGGYALKNFCESYGITIERDTNDIDVYTIDARALISGDVSISPTGAKSELTDGFYAELFDWISGMDHDEDLRNKIHEIIDESSNKSYEGKNVELYFPTPEIFVLNKLYSSKAGREKDLKDVKILTSILKDEGKLKEIEKIEKLVEQYNLTSEYKSALKMQETKVYS